MSTDIHHSIIAAPIDDQIKLIYDWVHEQAPNIQCLMCIGEPTHNFFQFVCMLPDGSSDGREASREGDKARDGFCKLLDDIGCDWVEVEFGSVDYKITRKDKGQMEIENL